MCVCVCREREREREREYRLKLYMEYGVTLNYVTTIIFYWMQIYRWIGFFFLIPYMFEKIQDDLKLIIMLLIKYLNI